MITCLLFLIIILIPVRTCIIVLIIALPFFSHSKFIALFNCLRQKSWIAKAAQYVFFPSAAVDLAANIISVIIQIICMTLSGTLPISASRKLFKNSSCLIFKLHSFIKGTKSYKTCLLAFTMTVSYHVLTES